MGSSCSALPLIARHSSKKIAPWKQLSSNQLLIDKFVGEGLIVSPNTVTNEEIELLALLHDDFGVHLFKKRLQLGPKSKWIACWEQLSSPKGPNIISLTTNCSKCLEILAGESSADMLALRDSLENCQNILRRNSKTGPASTSEELRLVHLELRRVCFRGILLDLYLPSMSNPSFEGMMNELGASFNQVTVNDFKYLGRLGSGGFGVVLHCVKSSTGEQYAMKVMLKAAVLRFYRRTPEKVMVERNALSCFDHPYLMSLSYAFQTPTLAIMVMPLGSCGDLSTSLRMSLLGRFSLKRVKFYVAEIVCGLSYLHANGIIYRDLKPQNVLLNADGHIMLADFGNIADTAHRVDSRAIVTPMPVTHDEVGEVSLSNSNHSNSKTSSRGSMPLLTGTSALLRLQGQNVSTEFPKSFGAITDSRGNSFGGELNYQPPGNGAAGLTTTFSDNVTANKSTQYVNENSNSHSRRGSGSKVGAGGSYRSEGSYGSRMSSHLLGKCRAKSIVGTLVYMAPEVMQLFGRTKIEYTKEIDCWSLGVLVYNLYTGQYPFRLLSSYSHFVRTLPALLRKHDDDIELAFSELFGPLQPFPRGCADDDVWALVKDLLQFDPRRRPSLVSLVDVSDAGCRSTVTSMPSGGRGIKTATDVFKSASLNSEAKYGCKEEEDEEADVDSLEPIQIEPAKMIHDYNLFSDVDWELLEVKGVPPPYVPSSESVEISADGIVGGAHCKTFEDVMKRHNNGSWIDGKEPGEAPVLPPAVANSVGSATKTLKGSAKDPVALNPNPFGPIAKSDIGKYTLTEEQQKYFAAWNFVAPKLIDAEIEAHKME